MTMTMMHITTKRATTKTTTRRRCCCYHYYYCLILLALFLGGWHPLPPVHAQAARAILNLGTRLKDQLTGGNSNNNKKNNMKSKTKKNQTESYHQEEMTVSNGRETLQQHEQQQQPEMDVSFTNIRLELSSKTKKNKQKNQNQTSRLLLDGSVSGRFQPGRVLAIMGPSGAGKSTLLHSLAGRLKDNTNMHLSGQRYVNGQCVASDSLLPAAFIEQEVSFFPHMTVRETLQFRVELKIKGGGGGGNGSSKNKKKKKNSVPSEGPHDDAPQQQQQQHVVEDLLQQLGLTSVADTIVGDAKIRGISGGERKRLSIAVEMINSPSILFLDEPTSGLDSTAATSLMDTLLDLAQQQGKTVVAVIHQPSQQVFGKLDDLILLSEGKLMYSGARDQVRNYMESQGFPAPDEMGTAEHILDCISRSPLAGESTKDADQRLHQLASAALENVMVLGELDDSKHPQRFAVNAHVPAANLLKQFKLLFTRSFREVLRGKTTIFVKTIQQVSLGLIYGGIYSFGTDQASIQDRFGLLSLIAIGAANMATASTVRAFPKEKAIISNELAVNMYRTWPYFIGKAISELPLIGVFNSIFGVLVYQLTGLSRMARKFPNFLGLLTLHGLACESVGLVIGAFAPNSDVALAVFPAVIVLNIIFDGKNISPENTPRLLRWIPKVGLIRWGFEGLCLNEFEGLQFDAKGPRRGPVARTGRDALARFGLGDNTLGDVVKAQLTLTSVCWLLSYIGLTLTRQKFQVMHPPKKASKEAER